MADDDDRPRLKIKFKLDSGFLNTDNDTEEDHYSKPSKDKKKKKKKRKRLGSDFIWVFWHSTSMNVCIYMFDRFCKAVIRSTVFSKAITVRLFQWSHPYLDVLKSVDLLSIL